MQRWTTSDGRPRPIPGLLPLLLYVLLRGLDATVLKGLQDHGMAHPVGGENPISFCNVFLAQLMVGLAALIPGRRILGNDLAQLGPGDRCLLALHGGLGLFLGPVADYLALESLSVISQTLLSALVFGAIALVLFGPQHFLLLRLWWVVAVLSAALLLGEPLGVPVLAGAALVLCGVFVSRRPSPIRSRCSPVSEGRHPRRAPPRT
ncbi:hypothetical protein [Cyanobium gracile]|uniref:EamA-like transporter family n=1 Tax=Cyanobium gracile (strain ATCC 27147 / PCC 6307) TaxID=292564 RepID=K9P9E6_CYAGP|nr:hypothetical protein [Cyanobium gracile]AFY29750.1 hypothetical protein Cyagr_2657 [Cyanobium gracile PCC 6307]